jgi:GDPmannose 4,6-dehydratase
MFGKSKPPQNENTLFQPRSVYAISKVFAYHSVIHYREAYNLHACNGILFNHESPRRGVNFVTKKIVQGLTRIKQGKQKNLILGNLYSRRDWGHAKESNKIIIRINKKYFRETEVDDLIGDFSKAKRLLKWKPKYSFNKLVDDMIEKEKYE